MAYFIRVLSPSPKAIPGSVLRAALAKDKLKADLAGEAEDGSWGQLIVTYPDGKGICVIERDIVSEAGAARFEIEELVEEVAGCQPESAAEWLATYLQSVLSIYALQVLGGAHERNGPDIVACLKTAIWKTVGGIIQVDNEGFTNEDGDHILWQFNEAVEGDGWMAVLDGGRWRKFRMDLGNAEHRASFLSGEVPPGLERAH
jgi:hypothetical protein